MEENPLPSPSSPNPEPSQPIQPAPAVTASSFSMPVQPAAEPTVTPVPNTAGEQPKAHSGKKKWILVAVGVLVVAGTAAGLYFGGFLGPAQQNADQLNGAAVETTPTQATQAETEQTVDVTNIKQQSLTSCPQGQVMDPVGNRCGCDINNNYFQVNLAGAYTQPSAGQPALKCNTCAQLSDQILTLGQSSDPADTTHKSELELVAKENNCTTCAVFDDRISKAAQDKAWDQYFNFVVEKSNDKTCGRSLSTCDSMKWQLLFMNDLRDKAGKDPGTAPDMLQTLKDKQQTLAEQLGSNATCYNLESLCKDLKVLYGTNNPIVPKQATNPTGISSIPLQGQSVSKTTPASTQQTQETQQSQQDLSSTNPDLSKITLDQLFDREFYMLHCPVDGPQQTTPAKGVKRVSTPVSAPTY